jgi:hypothetical protein
MSKVQASAFCPSTTYFSYSKHQKQPPSFYPILDTVMESPVMERGGSGPPDGAVSIPFDVGVFRAYLETLLSPGTSAAPLSVACGICRIRMYD